MGLPPPGRTSGTLEPRHAALTRKPFSIDSFPTIHDGPLELEFGMDSGVPFAEVSGIPLNRSVALGRLCRRSLALPILSPRTPPEQGFR